MFQRKSPPNIGDYGDWNKHAPARGDYGPLGTKRMRSMDDLMDRMGSPAYQGHQGGGLGPHHFQALMAENHQLRNKVMELTAANKFLLEQNAEMRNTGKGGHRPGEYDY